MIRAVIIDDKISDCEYLRQLIREKYDGVEILGIAHSAKEATAY